MLNFSYGEAESEQEGTVHIPLPLLGASSLWESWWYEGEVWHTTLDQVKVSGCEDYLFLSRFLPAKGSTDLRSATNVAYRQMLRALAGIGGFHLTRVWNYLGDINKGNHDRERYRQFSIGRAEALERHDVRTENSPVGTAIGGDRDCGLRIIGLASRTGFEPIENPRQISALNYPRRYGPQSPRFSRSGIVPFRDGALFLVSGTASVVGHESAFPFDTVRQIEATLDNLASLAAAASDHPGAVGHRIFNGTSIMRVYLRDPSDCSRVRNTLGGRFPIPDSQVIYVQGDICRQELMVEIEMCTVINRHREMREECGHEEVNRHVSGLPDDDRMRSR